MSTTSPEPAPEPAGARALHYISTFGPPSAVAAGLLFYFGWTRAHAQAEALGYDVAIAGLSNSDYVLRSVPALFLPILILVVAALLALRLHARLIGWVRLHPQIKRTTWLIRSLRWALIWFPLLGVLSLLFVNIGDYAAVPFTLTLGLLAYLYSVRVAEAAGIEREQNPVWRPLLLVLLVLLLFWDVERTARSFGSSYAELIVSQPERYFPIMLYSKEDLELEIGQPGVTEHPMGGAGSAYRFRYEGLRLLNYSSKKYFLLAPRPGSPSVAVLIIPDLSTIRVEF